MKERIAELFPLDPLDGPQADAEQSGLRRCAPARPHDWELAADEEVPVDAKELRPVLFLPLEEEDDDVLLPEPPPRRTVPPPVPDTLMATPLHFRRPIAPPNRIDFKELLEPIGYGARPLGPPTLPPPAPEDAAPARPPWLVTAALVAVGFMAATIVWHLIG